MIPISSAGQFDLFWERLNTYLAKPLTFSGQPHPGERRFPGAAGEPEETILMA
jgi:hypothetical protein